MQKLIRRRGEAGVEIWMLSDNVKRKLNNAEYQTGDLDSFKVKRSGARKGTTSFKHKEMFM